MSPHLNDAMAALVSIRFQDNEIAAVKAWKRLLQNDGGWDMETWRAQVARGKRELWERGMLTSPE